MNAVGSESYPAEDGLVKRLFSDSPAEERTSPSRQGDSPSKRDPLHGRDDVQGYRPTRNTPEECAKRKPRLGFCGALTFLALCLVALALTVQFSSWEVNTITSQGSRAGSQPYFGVTFQL